MFFPPQQWHGSPGQASLPHLKLKELQMSDSRELSNITTSSMYLLQHHFVYLLFWWILKIPKTATVTSPICQALRSARNLRHFSCFFFSLSVNSPCFLWGQWAISLCRHTGNEDQKKKKVFSPCFENFKDAFIPLHSITRCLPWTALIGEMKCSKHTQSVGVLGRKANAGN